MTSVFWSLLHRVSPLVLFVFHFSFFFRLVRLREWHTHTYTRTQKGWAWSEAYIHRISRTHVTFRTCVWIFKWQLTHSTSAKWESYNTECFGEQQRTTSSHTVIKINSYKKKIIIKNVNEKFTLLRFVAPHSACKTARRSSTSPQIVRNVSFRLRRHLKIRDAEMFAFFLFVHQVVRERAGRCYLRNWYGDERKICQEEIVRITEQKHTRVKYAHDRLSLVFN